ncbi:MAG: porin family protein [Alphaproteobacteria bacterium]|nr:MAG: porin family protein [Alphaproteobacteria bacterium]
MIKNTMIVAALIFPVGSVAQASEGDWYVSGQIGVRAIKQHSAEAPGVVIDGEMDNGTYAAGAVGYRLQSEGVGLRLEAEIASRGGNLNNLSVNGVESTFAGQGYSAVSFMTNGYVDLNNASAFTPYLGAGIGIARVRGDIASGGNVVDDRATSLAVQGIGGIDIAVSKKISLFVDLRYLKAFDTKLAITGSAGNGKLDVDYDALTVGVGARFRF